MDNFLDSRIISNYAGNMTKSKDNTFKTRDSGRNLALSTKAQTVKRKNKTTSIACLLLS